jgi:hypothetical protein
MVPVPFSDIDVVVPRIFRILSHSFFSTCAIVQFTSRLPWVKFYLSPIDLLLGDEARLYEFIVRHFLACVSRQDTAQHFTDKLTARQ